MRAYFVPFWWFLYAFCLPITLHVVLLFLCYQVGKDDLLSMVRYGAEKIFKSEATQITDEDIDAILQKGERDTAALNDKMQQFTEKVRGNV